MPEQNWNNLKFNIERALPSPNEHEQLALEGQVHDISNKIREQMARNKNELYAYNLFSEVTTALKNKGFEVIQNSKGALKEYKIQW